MYFDLAILIVSGDSQMTHFWKTLRYESLLGDLTFKFEHELAGDMMFPALTQLCKNSINYYSTCHSSASMISVE